MNAITLTDEQNAVIECPSCKILVKAYAGGSKTTILAKFAESRSTQRLLMLCYNATIAKSNKGKFPANTQVRTGHSLARESLSPVFYDRIGNLNFMDAKNILGVSNWGLVRDAVRTLEDFYHSPDKSITMANFKARKDELTDRNKDYNQNVLKAAQTLWDIQLNPDSGSTLDHDHYLKQFYLSDGHERLRDHFDYILVDEYQDSNAGFVDFLKSCDIPLLAVGDKYQQLYRHRGAVAAMDDEYFSDCYSSVLRLTKSFRFGGKIAMVASAILYLLGEKVPVVGCNDDLNVATKIPKQLKESGELIAYLHRTNLGAIETALNMLDDGRKTYWVGGIKKYELSKIRDVAYLSLGQVDNIEDKKFKRAFKDYDTYKAYADGTGDPDGRRSVKLIEKYKAPVLINKLTALEQNAVGDERQAQASVSTVHKAKGLEWNWVCLKDMTEWDRLIKPRPDEKKHWEEITDELHVYYVAVTRARRGLIIEANIVQLGKTVKQIKAGKIPNLPSVWLQQIGLLPDNTTQGKESVLSTV